MREAKRILPVLAFLVACGPQPQSGDPVEPSQKTAPVTKVEKTPPAEAPTGFEYPTARRGDVVDDHHGTQVPDPYRWLEDPDAPESRTWIEAQNKLTFGYLAEIPERDQIKQRLTALWNYEKYGVPHKEANRYFFSKNDGLQNQSVVYWTDDLAKEPKVLLDPNTLSKDGTVALAGYSVSEDGKHVAYGVQDAGSDWATWKVREIDSGKDLADEVKWVKFSRANWSKDSKGFYYSRYPEPTGDKELTGQNFYQKVYYHRVGTAQSKDELIFERPDEKKWGFGAGVTEDGRYLLVSVWKGTGNKNLIYYKDLKKKRRKKKGAKPQDEFTALIDSWDGNYSFVGNQGSLFWFFTDVDAPRGRLIAIDVRRPNVKKPKIVIPEQEATLQGVTLLGNRFFANYLEDAKSKIRIYSKKGVAQGEVPTPGIGSVWGFDGKSKDMETFYAFTSFTYPTTIYRYDVRSGKSTEFRRPTVDFDASQFEVSQVFYNSKDGTRVPMFIVHKKGLEKNGQNPTYLYGYGGFNISLTPSFRVSRAVWLEMGGILAIPNLRGGGEYGEEWHQQGIKLRKQNVFDDFIAAAEYLIENKYTSSSKLAIAGGSNGGLLVGAVMTQRPDLIGAALPAVGVLDMLRFHKFTIGWAWIDDYGSADDPEEFKALFAYSPYHNVKDGTSYPPTLITTGDHDDRVVPAHSFKFAAALQHAHKGDAPVLIRINTRAGHGAGKPTTMLIEETADIFAFLTRVLK